MNERSLRDVLGPVRKIRNLAVHRIRTTAKGVMELSQRVPDTANVLQYLACAARLEQMQAELGNKMTAIELEKNLN